MRTIFSLGGGLSWGTRRSTLSTDRPPRVGMGALSRSGKRAMGVSEGSRSSERTSGDDGAHPGRRRAASHNRPRTAAPKKLLLVDVIATSSAVQQIKVLATTGIEHLTVWHVWSSGVARGARTHPEWTWLVGTYRRRASERKSRGCGECGCSSVLLIAILGHHTRAGVVGATININVIIMHPSKFPCGVASG